MKINFNTKRKTNNQTEEKARDSQTLLGHPGKEQSTEEWLKTTYSENSPTHLRFKKIITSLLSKKTQAVLEIGAGIGDFSGFCMQQAPQHTYTISDLSKNLLTQNFDKVLNFFGVKNNTAYRLDTCSAEHLPFPDQQFDIVFIKSAVHHFENPTRAFDEIHRCLKPSGKVIFFNDPVCLNIPIYKFFKKLFFGYQEKKMGFNEHIYTLHEYLKMGQKYSKTEVSVDPYSYEKIEAKRNKIKVLWLKSILAILLKHKMLILNLALMRKIPLIFIFYK